MANPETTQTEEIVETVSKQEHENIKAAMQEERRKRKTAEETARTQEASSNERFARLEGRFEVLNKVYGGEDEEEIDPNVELGKKVELQDQTLKSTQGELAALRAANTLSSQESSFQADHSDYPQARQHYFDARIASLKAMGDTDEDAYAKTANELVILSTNALSAGESAPQRVYEAAKSFGYSPVTTEAEKQLETIQQGQAGGTLPAGAPPAGDLSMEAIEQMPDEEFAKLTESQLREAMGG